jgi:hypothetical protein
MTQQLVPYRDCLLQVSWGEMRIWSTETYKLLDCVHIFDRVVTDLALVAGIIICCGRDAIQESDRCGLDEGLKGWRPVWLDGQYSQGPGGEGKERGGQQNRPDSRVFRVGPPVRAARGLAVLAGSRLVTCVIRGATWFTEIWQI